MKEWADSRDVLKFALEGKTISSVQAAYRLNGIEIVHFMLKGGGDVTIYEHSGQMMVDLQNVPEINRTTFNLTTIIQGTGTGGTP